MIALRPSLSNLSEVSDGVCVVRLADGFEVDYGGFGSSVLYVGRGHLAGLLVRVVEGRLFDLWRALGTIRLRFFLAGFDGPAAAAAAQSLQSELMRAFGGSATPLLNQPRRPGGAKPRDLRFRRGWEEPVRPGPACEGSRRVLARDELARWKGALD